MESSSEQLTDIINLLYYTHITAEREMTQQQYDSHKLELNNLLVRAQTLMNKPGYKCIDISLQTDIRYILIEHRLNTNKL